MLRTTSFSFRLEISPSLRALSVQFDSINGYCRRGYVDEIGGVGGVGARPAARCVLERSSLHNFPIWNPVCAFAKCFDALRRGLKRSEVVFVR